MVLLWAVMEQQSSIGGTYVAWQWKANGGTTASNTDGTITTTTQVNSDAGFSYSYLGRWWHRQHLDTDWVKYLICGL